MSFLKSLTAYGAVIGIVILSMIAGSLTVAPPSVSYPIFLEMNSELASLSIRFMLITAPTPTIVKKDERVLTLTTILPTPTIDLRGKTPRELFPSIKPELLTIDDEFPTTASAGFVLLTSQTSHDKKRIVYSQISDCAANYSSKLGTNPCQWEIETYVGDLQTGKVSLIHEMNNSDSELGYLPLGWSKNDKKIIFVWVNPTPSGPGFPMGFAYDTYALDPNNPEMKKLASYGRVFNPDYEYVAFTETSDKTPMACGPGQEANSGKILLTNIDTGVTRTLIEEPYTSYHVIRYDVSSKTFIYKAWSLVGYKQTTGGGCLYWENNATPVPVEERKIELTTLD